MKNSLGKIWLSIVLAVAAVPVAFGAAELGKPAPDFTFQDLQGQSHQLSDYRGKTVVLEWVNPTCPFVLKHYGSGNMPATQKAAMDQGVVWLSINSAHPGGEGDFAPPQVSAWLKEMHASPTAYYRDQSGKVGRMYGAKTTPHMFVITKDGTLVYEGAIDSIRSADRADIPKATNYVKAALSAIAAGKPVEKSASQPYGCSVKY